VVSKLNTPIDIDDAAMTLCSKNEEGMYDWIRAIKEFHNCVVRNVDLTSPDKIKNEDDYKD
jgi:hypothetical protein